MHYNNYVELLIFRNKVNSLENELELLASSIGLKMLEIDRSLGLLYTTMPKRLHLRVDRYCLQAYDNKMIIMEYDRDTEHVEYVFIPIDYLFDPLWETRYVESMLGKAQLKANSEARNIELLERIIKLKSDKDT